MFSELVVIDVVEDQADLVVRFEEAAGHAAVVKDLLCSLGNLLWSRAKKVQWFVINGDLLTLFGTLEVRLPRTEDIFSVWEQDSAEIILGFLDYFEKLGNNPRFSWDSLFWLTSKDEEHILTLINQLLCLIVTYATQLHWWENGLIESISTAVKDADNKASRQWTQASESSLKVVKRGHFLTIRHDHLAVVILHHTMSTVVDYGQRVFALVRIVVDLSLVTKEDFLDFVYAKVRHFQDILAVIGKTVAFNLLFKEFDIALDIWEIFEA